MSEHDSHSHPSEAARAGAPFLTALGLFFLLLLVVVGGLLLEHSGTATETEDADRSAVRIKNLAELQAADTAQLTTYGWNDRAKGIIHIPITRAMELILPSLNAATAATAPVAPAPTNLKQP